MPRELCSKIAKNPMPVTTATPISCNLRLNQPPAAPNANNVRWFFSSLSSFSFLNLIERSQTSQFQCILLFKTKSEYKADARYASHNSSQASFPTLKDKCHFKAR